MKNPAKIIALALTKWVILCVVVGALLRIALLCHPITVASSLSFSQWLGLFVLGIINDGCISVIATIPLVCFWLSSGHWRFKRPQCYVFIALLVGGWAYLTFGCRQLWEFNKPLARIISWVMVGWTLTFILRAFVPQLRKAWMQVWTTILLFVYLGLLVMNTVGEWFFWNEFGVRYNFIAVDYLVYTSEVVGNIMQSYSMGWIITCVVILTIALEIIIYRNVIRQSAQFYHKGWRWQIGLITAVSAGAGFVVLPISERAQHSDNAWYNGLQANGAYSFVKAFNSNELDYADFYILCPDDKARELASAKPVAILDSVPDTVLTPNVVIITMESMSGDYLSRFGNTKRLTPVIDSLWTRSLAFERMFATGNRTVRGLEALVLSRPPSPGESIIKRKDNKGYPAIVDNFKKNGYEMAFYYGGNSYFDNMESFFSSLGYDIRDSKTMPADSITCQTVWGVCDGDVYERVIADLDQAYDDGKPTMAHILTTSNHRPYIYPDGCVAISTPRSREGAVMYSDYALGQFLNEAAKRPWFDNTVFVISADHCASSAGSTELPLANYHIPALVYAPALINAESIDKVVSQIDIMPTLFSLLGWEENANLYGENARSEAYAPRAFVATYQDLGYLMNDTLTVLSPGRVFRQYVMTPNANDPFATIPVDTPSWGHIYQAASIYQSSDK